MGGGSRAGSCRGRAGPGEPILTCLHTLPHQVPVDKHPWIPAALLPAGKLGDTGWRVPGGWHGADRGCAKRHQAPLSPEPASAAIWGGGETKAWEIPAPGCVPAMAFGMPDTAVGVPCSGGVFSPRAGPRRALSCHPGSVPPVPALRLAGRAGIPSVHAPARSSRGLGLNPRWGRQGKPSPREGRLCPGAEHGREGSHGPPTWEGHQNHVPCPNTLARSEPRAPTRRLQVKPQLARTSPRRWQGALACQGSYLFRDERHALRWEKPLCGCSAEPSEPPCAAPPGQGEGFSLKTNPRARQPPPPTPAGAELRQRLGNECHA